MGGFEIPNADGAIVGGRVECGVGGMEEERADLVGVSVEEAVFLAGEIPQSDLVSEAMGEKTSIGREGDGAIVIFAEVGGVGEEVLR